MDLSPHLTRPEGVTSWRDPKRLWWLLSPLLPLIVALQHSWKPSHLVSNLLLYQLRRHSDHHAHPARRYQALRHHADSPQLPAGYAAMLLLAYVPPLWFKVMDSRVLSHYGRQIARTNLHPPRRAALLARYGGSIA